MSVTAYSDMSFCSNIPYSLETCLAMAAAISPTLVWCIICEKYWHRQSNERTFYVVKYDESFENIEEQFKCSDGLMMNMCLAENEAGPWTDLSNDDAMFRTPVGVMMETFKNIRFLKMKCVPDQSDQPKFTEPPVKIKNAFDVLMSATKTQNTRRLPNLKISRSALSATLFS